MAVSMKSTYSLLGYNAMLLSPNYMVLQPRKPYSLLLFSMLNFLSNMTISLVELSPKTLFHFNFKASIFRWSEIPEAQDVCLQRGKIDDELKI